MVSTAAPRIAAALVALVVAAAAPAVAWRMAPAKTLEVVIVDKTVPFANYREHTAVSWLLHAMKIRNRAGKYLDPAHDYVGFDPATKRGRDVTEADLASADLLVVTDTYGVYSEDYAPPADPSALGRSSKIYGGLTEDESRAIEAFAARGGMVLGEFNAFASPTGDRARARLEALFGVRWTKWVARYWPNLRDEKQVPRWLARLYERVYGRPFDLRGGGLVFVREESDVVVLGDGEDLGAGVVSQEQTAGGAVFDLPRRGSFANWMDVVEATGAEVLYEHVVDATPAGERKLAAHGLSPRFPAVTRRLDAWYFAGDFGDSTMDLGDPERAWLLSYRQSAVGCTSAREAFFWGWYAPIVARLLSSRAK